MGIKIKEHVFPSIFSPIARTICLCLLVTAVGGTWLLEQPYQSLLRWYGRFRFLTYQMKDPRQQLVEGYSFHLAGIHWIHPNIFFVILKGLFNAITSEVFESCWWMRHYGGESPKRHVMFSNSPWVVELSLGRLVGWKKENNEGKKPCRTYVDSKGVRRFVGTKHLKGTEPLGCMFRRLVD